MTRHILGVLAGLATWYLLAMAGGYLMRESWPAYAQVVQTLSFAPEAAPPAFTLLMLIARLVMGALVTIGMGIVAARITPSPVAQLLPGVFWLIFFVAEHVAVWDKFPVWYHLISLLTFLPLTYLGNRIARNPRISPAPSVA